MIITQSTWQLVWSCFQQGGKPTPVLCTRQLEQIGPLSGTVLGKMIMGWIPLAAAETVWGFLP